MTWTQEARAKIWHTYLEMGGRLVLRPWWSMINGRWCRQDDKCVVRAESQPFIVSADPSAALLEGETHADGMARIDRDYPLPVPEPALGQMWFFDDEGIHRQIGSVAEFPDHWRVWWTDAPSSIHAGGPVKYWKDPAESRTHAWPPRGAICIDQKGRPWVPPGTIDASEKS